MNEQEGDRSVVEESEKVVENTGYKSLLNRTVPAWSLILIFTTFLIIAFNPFDPGRVESVSPSPTVTVTITAPPMGYEKLPDTGIDQRGDSSKTSSELIACASLPMNELVRSANATGIFSPIPASLEEGSAIWRWEMVDVGELVVIAIDTDLLEISALALLQSPGAVDALAGAEGVLDISVTASSGRWWVGIGTAFSVPVPLNSSQVESSASNIADCMNGGGSLKR
jgi:hypothetical protein